MCSWRQPNESTLSPRDVKAAQVWRSRFGGAYAVWQGRALRSRFGAAGLGLAGLGGRGAAASGMAWHRQGLVGRGRASLGGRGLTRSGSAWRGGVRRGFAVAARPGLVRQGKASRSGFGSAWPDLAWRGLASRSRLGPVSQGWVRPGRFGAAGFGLAVKAGSGEARLRYGMARLRGRGSTRLGEVWRGGARLASLGGRG